jgi:hypothetical protein
MADNVAITPGTGASIAADEVTDATLGSCKVQFTKLMDGTLDSTNKAVVNSSGQLSVSVSDSVANAQYNFPAGFVRTSDEPRQIFYDPFDTALDTTNMWTTPTVGNSATLASVSSGLLTMATGTTASGWSKLFSLPTFKPPTPAWIGFSFAINLPDGSAPIANSYRFWGCGTMPTTPTTAAPLTDAVGFELTTTGKLMAVVYTNGTRTAVQDLSSTGNNKQPLDTSSHRYIVYVRTDKAYWYIDSLATPVATSNFQSPSIQTLPMSFLAVGGSTPPATTAQIQCNGATCWDTGKNATQLADGTYPWRKAQISSTGGLTVAQSTGTNLHTVVDSGTITTVSAVTAITNQLPTGSNTIGAVKVTDGTNTSAVKAASTAAVATDPSLVVNISPNSPAHPVTQSGTWTVQPGNTVNTTAWLTTQVAISGGLSTFHLVSAATVNNTLVKSSAGMIYNIQAFNINTTSARYLKIYNQLNNTITAGTNLVATYLIPANGAGVVVEISNGMVLSTGIAFTITGGIADNDATTIAASEVVVNINYK